MTRKIGGVNVERTAVSGLGEDCRRMARLDKLKARLGKLGAEVGLIKRLRVEGSVTFCLFVCCCCFCLLLDNLLVCSLNECLFILLTKTKSRLSDK